MSETNRMNKENVMSETNVMSEGQCECVSSVSVSDADRRMAPVVVEMMRSVDSADRGSPLELPTRMTPGAAGCDLRSEETFVLPPMARRLVPVGICVAIPPGYEGQVRPRSGLAIKQGVTVINAPGTVDSDYRGELKVALVNLGTDVVHIHRGDRIAQLVIAPVSTVRWRVVQALPETERGQGGFGSTGK